MDKVWLKAALIRAARTMAQAALGYIGTAVAFNDVNWIALGMATVLAGLSSLLTSLKGLPEVNQV